jgi:predicted RNA-binding protein with PIN domain
MALRLVIDGYNYICAFMGLGGSRPGHMDPTGERDALIDKLVIYKKIRRAKITVVFDAARTDNLWRSEGREKGIEVVFSSTGEEADAIIKEFSEKYGKGLTIVTSDRELASYCELKGAVVVSSQEFHDLLEMALYADMKGIEEEEDDQSPSDAGGKRKGPARKLSKKEREKRKKLKKL